uniref:PX domain-containing protein n=1 Tax=Amphimedon queenslandica TaxID=400682 RepID=A0A1X7V9E2_AMPQE
MSPYRYSFFQYALILSAGCCGALAVLSLPTIAVFALILIAFLSYALVRYVFYHPGGRVWRLAIKPYLTSRLLLSASPAKSTSKRSELVHKEAQKFIQLIIRDFIVSWYKQISENPEFPQETVCLLEHLANDLQARVATVDIRSTILSLLPLLDPYLTALNEVGYVNERGKSTFDVTHTYCLMLFEKKPHLVHPALKNSQTEVEHLQRMGRDYQYPPSSASSNGGMIDDELLDCTDDSVYVNLPPIYIDKHVRVDTKDGVHTGYIIKFPSKMLDESQLLSLHLEEETELESLKRYSEFASFHKTLSNGRYSHVAKGLSLPDRRIFSHIINKIPFSSGEPDPTTILERKEGLESYLQSVVAVKEIKESPEFRQFLFSGVTSLQEAQIFSTRPGMARRDWRKSMAVEKPTIQSEQPFSDVLVSFTESHDLPMPHKGGALNTCNSPSNSNTDEGGHTSTRTGPVASTASDSITVQDVMQLIPTAVWSFFSRELGRGVVDDHVTLAAEREAESPLMNSLLSLANEATRTTSPELWITSEGTQLGILGICGDTLDSYLMNELLEVVSDETRWARALYNLRHLLWPNGGELSLSSTPPLTDTQKRQQRQEAVDEIKNFLPNALPWLIGAGSYDEAIEHCLNYIQNPRINRHFLFRALDILFSQIVPEVKDTEFQDRLVKMRSKPSFLSLS